MRARARRRRRQTIHRQTSTPTQNQHTHNPTHINPPTHQSIVTAALPASPAYLHVNPRLAAVLTLDLECEEELLAGTARRAADVVGGLVWVWVGFGWGVIVCVYM